MISYTMCGHPAWSDYACQECDGCRDGRARLRRIVAAAQNVTMWWENDTSMLEAALDELRDTLGARVIKDAPVTETLKQREERR